VKQAARLSILLLVGFACRSPEKGSLPEAAARNPPVEEADVATRAPRPSAGRPGVIWIGLDGLDWEILDRLAAEGKMPNWRRLVSTWSESSFSTLTKEHAAGWPSGSRRVD